MRYRLIIKYNRHFGNVVRMIKNDVTDITNSRAEPHFKATGRVISEVLIVNAANWPAFLPQI